MPESVPILLYRGMSEYEYEVAKGNGYFESDQHRYDNARLQVLLSRQELEKEDDPDEREAIQASIDAWEAKLQARELGGEFEQTFWADTYSNAAKYGEVVVTIRTKGIEGLFSPFSGRPGEWVSTKPVPFSAMHGAQLQLKRTEFEQRRRPEVRVRGHRRTLK